MPPVGVPLDRGPATAPPGGPGREGVAGAASLHLRRPGAGAAALLASASTLLFYLFRDALAGDLSMDTLESAKIAVSAIAAVAILLPYYWLVYLRDQREMRPEREPPPRKAVSVLAGDGGQGLRPAAGGRPGVQGVPAPLGRRRRGLPRADRRGGGGAATPHHRRSGPERAPGPQRRRRPGALLRLTLLNLPLRGGVGDIQTARAGSRGHVLECDPSQATGIAHERLEAPNESHRRKDGELPLGQAYAHTQRPLRPTQRPGSTW